MKDYESTQIRNISLNGHMSCGKSTLAEAMLLQTKAIDRMGKTEDGSLTSDYTAEEQKHQHSLYAAVLPVEYKKIKVNVLDCPGSRDFIGDIKPCVWAADMMLIVLDAAAGFEVGSELAFELSKEYSKPVSIFINKMDKENADFQSCLAQIEEHTGLTPIPVCLPIGAHQNFKGLVDLLRMKAIYAKSGAKPAIEDIPAEMADEAQAARAALIEAAAEGNEAIMEKFLDDQPLSDEEIYTGLRQVAQERRFIPVICGTATQCIGVEMLLGYLELCAPNPLEARPVEALKGGEIIEQKCSPDGSYSAFVFRSTSDPFLGKVNYIKVITGAVKSDSSVYNVNKDKDERIGNLLAFRGKKSENIAALSAGDICAIVKLDVTSTNDTFAEESAKIKYPAIKLAKPTVMRAIVAHNKTDEDKVGMAIGRILETDVGLKLDRNAETKQNVLCGMGETHLHVALERLEAMTNVKVNLVIPRVPYRETITKPASGMYRHKKQSGGRGQFGEVHLNLEPSKEGEGFVFEWKVVGGNIPTNYNTSVEKGVVSAMERGIVAGYQVVDVKVACFDGKYHAVDSSDMAFQLASSMAFREIAHNAGPIIMEPIVDVTVLCPEDNMGDIMGSISSKRGRPLGSESQGHNTIVKAQVPMSEMFDFGRELRSMTQGRATFEMEFSHYERVTPEIQAKIVDEYEKAKEAEH
ncbi:elongation factor G [Candidatus Sumerlaeota bacterium]|nr:elongation factor G [Candidatus Sumerlaeota bacterium]